MFMLMFGLGLISFVHASLRLFICFGAEKFMDDRFSDHRTKKWHKVWKHFGVTFLFFYLAFKL